MPLYQCQYRREQRVNFEIEADSAEEASEKAWKRANDFNLDSPDDSSDDPGELEVTRE